MSNEKKEKKVKVKVLKNPIGQYRIVAEVGSPIHVSEEVAKKMFASKHAEPA